jgi:ArsR family transcriptional regulator
MPITLPAVAHALSDPTRLAILERLRSGEQCVCTLTDLLEAGQSRLSFHLRVLREAGLVDMRRSGRWSYYRLRPDALLSAASLVAAFAVPAPATEAACCEPAA